MKRRARKARRSARLLSESPRACRSRTQRASDPPAAKGEDGGDKHRDGTSCLPVSRRLITRATPVAQTQAPDVSASTITHQLQVACQVLVEVFAVLARRALETLRAREQDPRLALVLLDLLEKQVAGRAATV